MPNNSESTLALTRRHPVDVAAQRVDLAVVSDHAIGMREPPGREGVGGEALMDQSQRGLVARIEQILVVGRELMNQHHALVDDRAARHRDGIIFGHAFAADRIDAVGDDLAQDEQLALELLFVGDVRTAADEDLPLNRLDRLHPLAQVRIVDGDVAPADEDVPFGGDGLLDDRLDFGARRRVARHEELSDRVMAGLRQVQSELFAFVREEVVRNLRQYAAAVAERGVRADGAAMVEIDEDLQALLQNGVRLAAIHVGDHADAARIALVAPDRRDLARAAAKDRRRARRGWWRRAIRRARRGRAGSVGPWRSSFHSPARSRSNPTVVRQVFAGLYRDKGGCGTRTAETASRGGSFSIHFDRCVRHRSSPSRRSDL